MKTAPFPGCCTASILYDFSTFHTKSNILHVLNIAKKDGLAMVVISLTDKQTNSYELCKSIGFRFTRAASKRNHPNTKLRLGWFLLEDLK